MRVIAKSRLRDFYEKHPNAEKPLLLWYRYALKADWNTFSNVREAFNHADIYQDCVVFDVGGNKYRLIVKIRYRIKRIYIRNVMTHLEYDTGRWKDDCRN